KWYDSRPVQVIVQRPGEWFPASVEQIKDDGTPGEWQRTQVVYFRDLQWGHDYSFFTSSWGGIRAVETLARQTINMRYLRPGALPLVELKSGRFRSKQYGDIPCPVFNVVGWVNDKGEPYDPVGQKALLPKAAVEEFLDDSLDDLPFNR